MNVMDKNLFDKIKEKIEEYKKALENVGIAQWEQSQLSRTPETEADLLADLDVIIEAGKELSYVIEEAPDSVFVCDGEGTCLRINKAYEKMVAMDRREVLGRNVADLEAEGIFRPSVSWLTLQEKRPVSVLQQVNDMKGIAVTGVPVFDKNGTLFRVVTNAIKVDDVEALTQYVLRKEEAQKENCERKKIIADSPIMKQILSLADMVKDTESNVLITGETGVGKGVLASYIHESSIRAKKKMVSINCGAIPDNLLESELFGYETGAFTGADQKGKPGLIELSQGGTLFLDEISELPLMLQVKILHFLQTKKLTRVGGIKEIVVDTRIIAASNKVLNVEVQEGRFRSDLYYRINVIPIIIPPLRERREDIKAMTEYFLSMYMKKYSKKIKVDEQTMGYIMNHDWRGNVRELENYIERLVVTNDSKWFLAAERDIDETQQQEKGRGRTIADIEKDIIMQAYVQYKSSYRVAEALGISQSTAHRRIKKYLQEPEKNT